MAFAGPGNEAESPLSHLRSHPDLGSVFVGCLLGVHQRDPSRRQRGDDGMHLESMSLSEPHVAAMLCLCTSACPSKIPEPTDLNCTWRIALLPISMNSAVPNRSRSGAVGRRRAQMTLK